MSVKEKMTAIADAIRAKTGGTDPLTLDQMATEIASISGLDTQITEFTQMNDKVTAFLAAADAAYTADNGGTVSVIGDYATAEGDYDRPLGLEITAQDGTRYVQNEARGTGGMLKNLLGGKSVIYNAIPNEVSQYLVKDSNGNVLNSGRIKPTGKVRMIKFYGYPQNCRDLGGWDCDGGTVKYGRIFRSAAIGETSDILYAIVKELGIRHEIDLRNADEITTYSLADVVHFHHIPLSLYFENVIDPEQESYENIKSILRTVFNAVTHGEAVLYHCAIGRDRTGTVTALLLSLLGVSVVDVEKDFELTSFSKLNTPAYRTNGGLQSLLAAIKSYDKSDLMHGAVSWCLKAGFTIDEINGFRSAMVDGIPTVLNAADYATIYTVTQTLSNCTSSFTNDSVVENDALSVTITPSTNYELSAINVTMGGTNITSTAVSGNTIAIVKVTGDVVITATASKTIAYTNLLPTAVAADGTIYNDIGYKPSTKLNSSGGDTSGNGMCASGYMRCAIGDVIRMQGINYNKTSSNYGSHRIAFFKEDKSYISLLQGNSATSDPETTANGVYDSTGELVQFTVPAKINTIDLSTAAWFRVCGDTFNNGAIITVNEPIIKE